MSCAKFKSQPWVLLDSFYWHIQPNWEESPFHKRNPFGLRRFPVVIAPGAGQSWAVPALSIREGPAISSKNYEGFSENDCPFNATDSNVLSQGKGLEPISCSRPLPRSKLLRSAHSDFGRLLHACGRPSRPLVFLFCGSAARVCGGFFGVLTNLLRKTFHTAAPKGCATRRIPHAPAFLSLTQARSLPALLSNPHPTGRRPAQYRCTAPQAGRCSRPRQSPSKPGRPRRQTLSGKGEGGSLSRGCTS